MIRVIAVMAAVLAAPSFTAAPVSAAPAAVRVSATDQLTDGQRITVQGSGFRPGLAAVAVGLCKQNFTNGITDCDLEGGATFVNIDGDGTFPTVTLAVRSRFGAIDCGQQPCVIAAAPLPGTEPPAIIATNSAQVPVTFAGAAATAPVPAGPPATALPAADIQGPSTVLWGVTAALLLLVAGLTAINRRRL
ncbi:neocarzinostatin apoprotein domain-containing protein [Nocardia fluminea]|uniref:neocarzinostatin apoprotein domain-containing protein n=1 Tax=Nocardia fluminea TaxID=134984 RepID=UPI00366AC135